MNTYPFENAKIYPAGALLQVRVYGVIRHVGLATGYGTVIHASRRFGRVEETDLSSFLGGGRAQVVPYKHSLSGSEIVARARSKKGQRYNVLTEIYPHVRNLRLGG